jgi:hypothetical protein
MVEPCRQASRAAKTATARSLPPAREIDCVPDADRPYFWNSTIFLERNVDFRIVRVTASRIGSSPALPPGAPRTTG